MEPPVPGPQGFRVRKQERPVLPVLPRQRHFQRIVGRAGWVRRDGTARAGPEQRQIPQIRAVTGTVQQFQQGVQVRPALDVRRPCPHGGRSGGVLPADQRGGGKAVRPQYGPQGAGGRAPVPQKSNQYQGYRQEQFSVVDVPGRSVQRTDVRISGLSVRGTASDVPGLSVRGTDVHVPGLSARGIGRRGAGLLLHGGLLSVTGNLPSRPLDTAGAG